MDKSLLFFGGTFDPPHVEHVNMLKHAVDELQPEKTIVMPTFIPPHKQTLYCADAKFRYEACKIAFEGISGVEVSDYEIKKEGKSYSYATLEYLKSEYPDYVILFLMGTDMMASFKTWKYPTEILKNCIPVLCARDGENQTADETLSNFSKEFGVTPKAVNYEGSKVSSTEFKIRYMLGLSTSGLVTDDVFEYIEDNGVYAADKYFAYVRQNLKKERIEHTAGVVCYALKHSGYYDLDKRKVTLAALLHDVAKYKKIEELNGFSLPSGVPKPVIHQYAGEFIARNELGVTDEDILDAIKFHTSGKENMSDLGKLIFTADMLEDGRKFDGVDYLRKIADEDFEQGFIAALNKSYEFVVSSGKPVYGKTKDAINYYGGNFNGFKTKN